MSGDLNNMVEQDRRRVEQRIYPTLGFEGFANAAVTIGGVELVQKNGKGQFDTPVVIEKEWARVPRAREAVLAG